MATKAGNIVAAVPALRKAGRTPSRNPRAKGHESWPEDFGLDPLKHTGQAGEKISELEDDSPKISSQRSKIKRKKK